MKVVAVVGTKKVGKTTLVEALVGSLRSFGRVGTIKNMQGHQVDRGDTRRHFLAGADEVIGLGDAEIKVTRGGSLESALAELYHDGMDFALVEGFKGSALPKIIIGDIDVVNAIARVNPYSLNENLLKELTDLVMDLEEYHPEA